MKELGITMTPENIRLILAGKKTMTRRVTEKIDKYKNLKTGDRLYIQETWTHLQYPVCGNVASHYFYKMDGEPKGFTNVKWEPSMFMPKSAARYWLEVIRDPWLENIQDISKEDIEKEGIMGRFYRNEFIHLWNDINEKRGYCWISNPRDRAIEFKYIGDKNGRKKGKS